MGSNLISRKSFEKRGILATPSSHRNTYIPGKILLGILDPQGPWSEWSMVMLFLSTWLKEGSPFLLPPAAFSFLGSTQSELQPKQFCYRCDCTNLATLFQGSLVMLP